MSNLNDQNLSVNGNFIKKDSDNVPKRDRNGGRGQFLQAVQSINEKEDVPSLAAGGRGIMLQVLRECSALSARDKTSQHSLENTSQPEVGRRGKFLENFRTSPKSEPLPPHTSGRGIIMSTLRALSQPAMNETPPSEISSTTDALAQLRLKQHEESSCLSEIDEQSFHELEAEAASFVNVSEEAVAEKRGTAGTRRNALTNFIRLEVDSKKGVFEYEVNFVPDIHSNAMRYALFKQHQSVIGQTHTFDGAVLCLPKRLSYRIKQFKCKHPNDNSDVAMVILYKGRKKFSECNQLYGILFSKIMKILEFIRFGTKHFDPKLPKIIPHHKLEIWPGFVTAVNEVDGGVMLCVDVTHRILCQTTVIDILRHAHRSARGNAENFRKSVEQALIGAIVITRYNNNKSYRIDDIDFGHNPTDTFRQGNVEISYVQYYNARHGIDITDLGQPLLINRKMMRFSGQDVKETCLIPELCHLTGLTDDQRNDFQVMRDVASYTRITPNQRDHELKEYCKRVNEEPITRQLLANWGLRLMDHGVELEVRQFDEERVIFANNKSFGVGPNADFGKYSTNNEMLEAIPLTKWLLIHTKSDQKAVQSFIDCMVLNSRPMGINASKPKIIVLENDRIETWAQMLRQVLNVETQIVVCVCPTSRDDRYSTIKRICCAESPIPSQVINARTLSNESKNRSIVQKIALQMNCKMGGTLWSIKIPLPNTMIVGIDSYRDKNRRSVSAFVASINDTYTRWYSKAIIQKPNEELVNGLVDAFHRAMTEYRKYNSSHPQRIIIFRDGVGDGQLKTVKNYELAQLKTACTNISKDYKPSFTFLVVQKRVNTRFYIRKGETAGNPLPGTVLDHTITRRGLQDFYLVPQSVRQGTVMPIHYIVIADENNFKPDIIQRLTYKLCFLYYNWPGAVRVPACCQYAHKLAFLVAQSLNREPAAILSNRLFYL